MGTWARAGYVVVAPLFPRSSDTGGNLVGDYVEQPADLYTLTQKRSVTAPDLAVLDRVYLIELCGGVAGLADPHRNREHPLRCREHSGSCPGALSMAWKNSRPGLRTHWPFIAVGSEAGTSQ